MTGLDKGSDATFQFATNGKSVCLEMHDDSGVTEIARIKGEGIDDLGMSSSELGLIWA